MFVLGHFVSLAITRMRIKTLLAAAAAEPSGGGGGMLGGGGVKGHWAAEPSRARCGPWPGRCRCRRCGRGGLRGVRGGGHGAQPRSAPGLLPRGSARARQGPSAPRRWWWWGGVHRRAGAQVCFVLLGFSPLFPFSSSVGLLGAAGLGEQRGHAKSKGSPDAGPCRGTTGGLLPHPSSPPARPGEPSPLPSEAPDFPGARQTLLAAVTRAQHRQGGQEWTGMDGAGGGGGRWQALGVPLGISGPRPPPTRLSRRPWLSGCPARDLFARVGCGKGLCPPGAVGAASPTAPRRLPSPGHAAPRESTAGTRGTVAVAGHFSFLSPSSSLGSPD